jgi:hypothetical protein
MAENSQSRQTEKKTAGSEPMSRPVPPPPQWVWEGASFLPLRKHKGVRK